MAPDLSIAQAKVEEAVEGGGRARLLAQGCPAASTTEWCSTHGAGGNCETPLLVAISDAFQSAGVSVLRCNLPFRQRRPTGPPGPSDAARDRAGLQSAVAALKGIVSGRITLSGVSYGGRQASILATNEPQLVDALMLLSYASAGEAHGTADGPFYRASHASAFRPGIRSRWRRGRRP